MSYLLQEMLKIETGRVYLSIKTDILNFQPQTQRVTKIDNQLDATMIVLLTVSFSSIHFGQVFAHPQER